MKIAYVFDLVYPYSKGGVERRTWEMARRHAKNGHDVTVFGMKQWPGPSTMIADGVRYVGVCPKVQVYVKGRRSVGAAVYFGAAMLLPLIRERFDVINVSISPYFPCLSAKVGSILRGSRLVFSCWEIWGDYWSEYAGRVSVIGRIIERLTIRLPRWMVVETADTKRGLKEWGFDPGRVTLVPSGADNGAVQGVPAAGPADASDVIYVGRLIEYKGVRILIQAIGLLKQRGKMVRAAIVGDGPDGDSFRKVANELGVDDRVRFYGRIEDGRRVISIMKASKVFAYPAAPLGGWALTPLEANAAGLPVITTRSGPVMGSTDVVQDGYNGLLLRELTPESMAEKLTLIVENPRLRQELRAHALEFARRYDWDNQTRDIEGVYHDAAVPPKGRSPRG